MGYGEIVSAREYWPATLAWKTASYGTNFDLPVSGAAADNIIITGSNQFFGVSRFADAAALTISRVVRLASDLYVPGNLALRLFWKTPATVGSVRWTAETAFAAPGDTLDPAFNAPTEVVQAADAVSEALSKADFTALDVTGCVPGALMFLRIGRDATDSDDVLADAVDLIGVEFQYQRRMVLP